MKGFWLELIGALYCLHYPSGPERNSSAPSDPVTQIFPNATYPGAINKASLAGATSLESSPPHYPSPWADGTGDWAHAYAKAKDFVSKLTLLEKVNLTTGVG